MVEFAPRLLLDPYDRPARLVPALLVLLPVPVLVVCLFGTAKMVETSVISILAYCGVSYGLARIARNAGKRLQNELFDKWDGAPTTQLLRHRDTHFDHHTKSRYHEILSRGIGQPLPNETLEAASPAAADDLYRASALWLIGQTRDIKRFPLVFKENVAFGFHRNSLGVRWTGVLVAVACFLIALAKTGVLVPASPYVSLGRLPQENLPALLTLSVSGLMLFAWLFLFTESSVKRAGFAYAERLLESCDSLTTQRGPK